MKKLVTYGPGILFNLKKMFSSIDVVQKRILEQNTKLLV